MRTGHLDSHAVRAGLLTCLGYYLGARVGLAMAFPHYAVSVLWPPNSILLAALLLTPPRIWWLMILSALPAHLLAELQSGVPWRMVFCWFISNSCEALIGAAATRAMIGAPVVFNTRRKLGCFFLGGVFLAPFLSSFLDAGFVVANRWGQEGFWSVWRLRFYSNVMAVITIVPAIVAISWFRISTVRALRPMRVIEAALMVVCLLLTSLTVFYVIEVRGSDNLIPALMYVPLPFLLWAAIRFGVGTTSLAILAVTLLAVWGAVHSHGPFVGNSPEQNALSIQLFLVVISVTLLPLAVASRERRQMEEALRASEERYRGVVESQTDMVCRYLPDMTLTFVNEAYCRFFKRRRKELIGRKFLELLPESAHERARHDVATLLRQRGDLKVEHEVILPDGTIGWHQWHDYVVTNGGGEVVELQGIGQDITERKRAEEARQNLSHASRLAVMGEFTAMIAHEINQPLGAILSNAEAAEMLLAAGEAPLEKIREILEDIRKDDLRASEAIRRIRTLLQKREMSMQPLDANEMVSDVLRLASGDALRRRVQLHRDFSPSIPLVQGDSVHLQQVLLNLILNAMDAMNNVSETERHLFIATRGDGNGFVEIMVKDSGHGVPTDKKLRIFDSFFTTRPDGMGLGLSIARSIIEAHRGRIWVENNNIGKGATFHFTVPASEKVSTASPKSDARQMAV